MNKREYLVPEVLIVSTQVCHIIANSMVDDPEFQMPNLECTDNDIYGAPLIAE